MSLFSFLRKNKQDSDTDDRTFYSRAEEDSKTARSRSRTRGKRDAAADPVLPEKKRARRRLIGAVALVLAAVVGLPMVLDSEPRPLSQDIEIRIPSREKPAAPPMAAANPDDNQAALDDQEEVVEPARKAPSSTQTPDKAAASPARAPAAPADKAEVKPPLALAKPEPRPEVKPEPKPPAKPEPKPQAKPEPKPEPNPLPKAEPKPAESEARARALLEGRADPASEKKDSGKYVIQVAALAAKDKVNELQSKLKSAGIQSYTQTVSTASGERTRIRVGPFANRDEAEKVRARIVNLGLNGTLVPA